MCEENGCGLKILAMQIQRTSVVAYKKGFNEEAIIFVVIFVYAVLEQLETVAHKNSAYNKESLIEFKTQIDFYFICNQRTHI